MYFLYKWLWSPRREWSVLPNKAGGRWGGGQGEARAQRGVGLVAHQSRSSQLSSAVAEAASRFLSSEGFWVHAAPLAMGYVIVCAPSPCRGMVRCKLYGSRCLFIPLYSLSCSSFDSYIPDTLFVVPFVIFSHFLMVCYTEILLFDKGT